MVNSVLFTEEIALKTPEGQILRAVLHKRALCLTAFYCKPHYSVLPNNALCCVVKYD